MDQNNIDTYDKVEKPKPKAKVEKKPVTKKKIVKEKPREKSEFEKSLPEAMVDMTGIERPPSDNEAV